MYPFVHFIVRNNIDDVNLFYSSVRVDEQIVSKLAFASG